MTTRRAGESPTKLESAIISLHEHKDKYSCFQIANMLQIDPLTVRRVTNYWCAEEPHNQPGEKTTMAKSDKNKDKRGRNMEKLREGDPLYTIPMDDVRGLLGDLEDGECLICIRTSQTGKVNIRLGDCAYS